MKLLILDLNLSEKLQQAGQSVDLCSPTGEVIGKFIPNIDLAEWGITGETQSVFVDAKTMELLQAFSFVVELGDPTGMHLGRYVRPPLFDSSEWEFVGSLPTDEELERIANSVSRTYTTQEVLEYLHSLDEHQ